MMRLTEVEKAYLETLKANAEKTTSGGGNDE